MLLSKSFAQSKENKVLYFNQVELREAQVQQTEREEDYKTFFAAAESER